MSDFRRALNHLRQRETAAGFSISAQLQFLKSRIASERSLIPDMPAALPPGNVESTRFGSHYAVRCGYPHDYFHGKVRLSRFSAEELSALMTLMKQRARPCRRERVIFLDTETTGMQGGVGMCPFLVGVGYFEGDDFRVDQFFIRDFDEEPSMLAALCELLSRFDLVVTYNGAAFDIPLLETRLRLARIDNPFQSCGHFDLLNTARRLWRNGHGSCRLVALERSVMSFLRGPDVPGSMIPRVYFDFLQHRPAPALPIVFAHNVYDIVSLAALTVLACDCVVSEPALLDDALDVYSLARIIENSEDWRRSLDLYERAIAGGLPEPSRLKALENLSVLCRRAGRHERAFQISLELIENPSFSMTGYEGAAIYHERVAEDCEAALQVVEAGLRRVESAAIRNRSKTLLRKRWDRLQQKVIGFPSSRVSQGEAH